MTESGARRSGDPRVQRSRRAILDAGGRLLLAGGVPAVTIDAVVAASGVAATTIYRHFPSRRDLVVALFAHLMPLPQPEPPAGADLRSTLVGALTGLAAQLAGEPWGAAVPSLLDEARRDPDLAEVLERLVADRLAVFGGLLEGGAAAGRLPAALDVDTAVSMLVGPVVFRHLVSGQPVDAPFCAALVDHFLAARPPLTPEPGS